MDTSSHDRVLLSIDLHPDLDRDLRRIQAEIGSELGTPISRAAAARALLSKGVDAYTRSRRNPNDLASARVQETAK